jgi:hypothetical protein
MTISASSAALLELAEINARGLALNARLARLGIRTFAEQHPRKSRSSPGPAVTAVGPGGSGPPRQPGTIIGHGIGRVLRVR